jgi:hypothetical protein
LTLADAERATCSTSPAPLTAPAPRRRPGKRWTARPSLQWVLDKFTPAAIVRNGRMDLLASNHLGRAMHAALYEPQPAENPASPASPS